VLGLYLGDGWLSSHGTSTALNLALDLVYQEIIDEAGAAISRLRGRVPWTGKHRHKACMRVVSYWKQWPCFFPQHGPGRKHTRPIRLTDWQWEIVSQEPEPLLRALIQTDGWRGLNKVHVKGKDYAYPRYQFSNRSDDIRKLFCDACDLVGVEWRPWGRWHISVARRDSVARLDEFIGLKS
jgi:hypothetical protein